ncbi:MAG: PHP domain-containing protein [Clostridia bacterium]|nr:PHP domain-containing protein [Clostridia bacterium]
MKNNIINGCIDLHTHSTASDGTMTPSELALHAKRAGLSAVALTDHDTLSGLREFCSKCGEIGIEGIPGVEIGAKYKCEMHLLGLFVDYENKEFYDILDDLAHARAERNRKMLQIMNEGGIDITEEDIISQKETRDMNSCGRAHFAAALVKKGLAEDFGDAFDKYIGKGKPFYAARKAYPPNESIRLIKLGGGIAVLAHPMYITTDRDELRALLTELKGYGLDGVECYYSQYDNAFTQLCLELCEELDLIPTGGSDFHAENKPHIPIGIVGENRGVPYEVLERLKEYKKSNCRIGRRNGD